MPASAYLIFCSRILNHPQFQLLLYHYFFFAAVTCVLYMEDMPEFAFRMKVKAGLAGYAQVYGKYNTTPYDKLKLDLTYIDPGIVPGCQPRHAVFLRIHPHASELHDIEFSLPDRTPDLLIGSGIFRPESGIIC